jgi:glycosyltransferase involved in cell wall biosynthesis
MKNFQKIKVMHIINNLEIGGAERLLISLLKELSIRNDIELHLVSLEGHGSLLSEVPANITVKSFKYDLFSKFSILNPGIKFKLLKYVKKIKPDLIHGHLIKGEDIAKITGILTNTPVVVTSHDIFSKPGFFVRSLNKSVKKYIAVSEVVSKHLAENNNLQTNQITTIPNAIDTKMFYRGAKKFDKNSPVFIYIGRILKLKGIDDAINGIAGLQSIYPKLKFLIYGKEVQNKDIDYLKRIITDNNYDFVEFMGPTDDVPLALSKGDIFVLPSKSEGFAISALEAAAAKKPIVATRVGAIPEIVKDGVSGFLVDTDSPYQIFESCKKILDGNLVEKFGNEAQKIANSKFSINKMSKQYFELYKSLIKTKS